MGDVGAERAEREGGIIFQGDPSVFQMPFYASYLLKMHRYLTGFCSYSFLVILVCVL